MVLDQLRQMARAVEDAWAAPWAALGEVQAVPRTIVDHVADPAEQYLRVYTPGMPEMLLNLVMCYRTHRPIGSADIERVIAPFRQHRLPFQWWVTPGLEPQGLRDLLRALGMQSWGGSTSMTLSLPGWRSRYRSPVAGTAFSRSRTEDEAHKALNVICEVYYLMWEPMARWALYSPGVRMYYATLNGHPVAALTTMARNGIVLIYNVATLPGARRRGIAGNLVALALSDAHAEGCTLAALTATAEARHLYEELGFRACGTMEQWAPTHAFSYVLQQGQRSDTIPEGRHPLWR
jgi:GNAT superfamily N-acetyltransferase